jgi:hypothetical protein
MIGLDDTEVTSKTDKQPLLSREALISLITLPMGTKPNRR